MRVCSILFRVKHRLASSYEEPQPSDLVFTPWRPHHCVQILASIESIQGTENVSWLERIHNHVVEDSSGTETRDVLLDLSSHLEHVFSLTVWQTPVTPT